MNAIGYISISKKDQSTHSLDYQEKVFVIIATEMTLCLANCLLMTGRAASHLTGRIIGHLKISLKRIKNRLNTLSYLTMIVSAGTYRKHYKRLNFWRKSMI